MKQANQSNQLSGTHGQVCRPRYRLLLAIALLSLAMVACVTATMPRPDDCEPDPDQAAVIFDAARSHPACCHVRELMAAGKSEQEAWEEVSAECQATQHHTCLVYEIVVLYCDSAGVVNRIDGLIGSNCIEQTVGDGCLVLAAPFTPAPGEPDPGVYECPSSPPGLRPMWDTPIDPGCLGLPDSTTHVWVYPPSPYPKWGPCEGLLACDCFPGFADCNSLVVECRNPARPKYRNGNCPDGTLDH